MGIENAILELAAAIRYAADKTAGGTGNIAKLIENVTSGSAMTTDTIEQDVAKVETDAKAEQKRVMALVEADRKPGNAKAAIEQALADAKAAKEAATAPVVEEDDPLDAAPLDWDKDVRPALLAVGKDRDALVKLMAKYDVPKGGKAPAEKWADLLAEANKIVAARG